jgi:hypothetical protein
MTGNGLFIRGMARKRKDLNFLGLEMNEKVFFFFFFLSFFTSFYVSPCLLKS